MSTHVVTRPLPKGGTVLRPGTEVDASAWRNARLLEEQRYIRPLSASESVKPGPEVAQAQPDERDGKRVGRKGKDESGQ